MKGTVINHRYTVLEHMHKCQFSRFWAARDETDGSPVALKLLKAELVGDYEAEQRHEREAKLLAGWKHPNLLRVIDSGRTPEGVPWLATRITRVRPLYDEIADQTATIESVCSMASQIARVLAGAHARGIVHRGICPDAIVLCEERGDAFRVKVLDFGTAHIDGPEGDEDDDEDYEELTQTGQRLGDAEYMAPEYITGFELDARTDIYALGILIFEMLTGQPPFVGSMPRVIHKHLNEPPIKPSELSMHEVPGWLDQLVVDMLQKEPGDRPQKALEVVDRIAKGLG